MFNSQEINLFSQALRLDQNLPKKKIAERKTLPTFNEISSLSSQNTNESSPSEQKNFTFTYIPTSKHFEEESISQNFDGLGNLNHNSQSISNLKSQGLSKPYKKQMKSYIIKPKLQKAKTQNKKTRQKKVKHSSLQKKNIISQNSNDIIDEESSQTSVDESDDDIERSINLIKDNVNMKDSILHIPEKVNDDLTILGNSVTINVVLYNIQIKKVFDVEGKSPYCLFSIKGEKDCNNILHYDNDIFGKKIISLLTQGIYIQCKMLQKRIDNSNNSLFKKKIISYSLISIENN